ncbi:MAG: ATP-binding protein [Candidatus Thiodiazotropha sp. (ex Troendleina suluensis)]|nr:ATP-binding protein [Candidatus Thiodiazotropha sp. (ex Troendleina suluensis)]
MADDKPSIANQDDMETANNSHLTISAHVVIQLGEELVTDIEQALLEVTKNAYDADSTICEIIIEPDWNPGSSDPIYKLLSDGKLETPLGRIRVRDYGSGIPSEAIEQSWLRISSSIKRSKHGLAKKKTALGRIPVGDKGLGRLATMKLGSILRLKTAIEGESAWRTVSFSWDDFTVDRSLEDVPVFNDVDSNEEVTKNGTIVEVIGLRERDKWLDSGFIEKHLVPNLSSLINPFRTIDQFEIRIKTRTTNHEIHSLDSDSLNLSSAKFAFDWDGRKFTNTALISPTLFRGQRGEEQARLFAKLFSKEEKPNLIEWLKNDKRLKDMGILFDVDMPWFFKLEESIELEQFPKDKAFPNAKNPGKFNSEIFYFLFHEDTKHKLAQVGTSAEALKAMSQIAIFRDGFRVRAQRDWLRLSEGTTSGSSYYGLRPSNSIGYFSISNEHNHGLVEKSDREGFVDTHEYRGFMVLGLRAKDYADRVLELVRKSVNNYVKSQNYDNPKSNSRELLGKIEKSETAYTRNIKNINSKIESAKSVLESFKTLENSQNSPDINNLKNSVEIAENQLDSVVKSLDDITGSLSTHTKTSKQLVELAKDEEGYAARLLDSAAVGLAARSLTHELHQFVRQLKVNVASVSDVNKSIQNRELAKAIRGLNGTIREMSKTISTIDPLLPGTRSIKENISLSDFIDEFVNARRAKSEKYSITLQYDKATEFDDCVVRFSRTRLLQIIENLFQNSLYWLRHGPVNNESEKTIIVTVVRTGIIWADSGPGIRPSLESSIFDPYISDKPSSEASGLGLHVVSTFLEVERCNIQLSSKRNWLGRKYEFILDMTGAYPKDVQRKLQGI